ncbi:hypothetical protein DFH09DRAFT_1191072 [Mycena vulgaris]|nr:hypothetical protein DFH09DRAFT_1212851 [Mycena vulgaris]KAJ6522970.1 hypothetical protein DFH09DRAFT_1191072 [Mycena vulgaris]
MYFPFCREERAGEAVETLMGWIFGVSEQLPMVLPKTSTMAFRLRREERALDTVQIMMGGRCGLFTKSRPRSCLRRLQCVYAYAAGNEPATLSKFRWEGFSKFSSESHRALPKTSTMCFRQRRKERVPGAAKILMGWILGVFQQEELPRSFPKTATMRFCPRCEERVRGARALGQHNCALRVQAHRHC